MRGHSGETRHDNFCDVFLPCFYDEKFTEADYENESFMIKFFETANITFERTYNTCYSPIRGKTERWSSRTPLIRHDVPKIFYVGSYV